MASEDDDTNDVTVSSRSSDRLPPFPSDEPHQHQIRLWLDAAKMILAPLGLMSVAEGQIPIRAQLLTPADPECRTWPTLPTSDPNYHKMELDRRREIEKNRVRVAKAELITMTMRTKLYMMLAKCCENTAPTLHRRMVDECPLSTLW